MMYIVSKQTVSWILNFVSISSSLNKFRVLQIKTLNMFGHIGTVNPGRFGPGSFRPESFRPGSFRPILGVGRFGLGRWVVSANFLGESIRP